MGVYRFDGESYAGWKSVGRWFALSGAVALIVGAIGFSFVHGHPVYPRAASDQMLAFAAQCVGLGLFLLMAVAAYGSIRVSLSERGSIEVTDEGIRRIFTHGREEFFPRQQIAGLVPGAMSITLVGNDNARQMVIPRGIGGFRDCVAEMRGMGIEILPASRLKASRKNWKRALSEWIFVIAVSSTVNIYFDKGDPPRVHHIIGLALVALVLLGIELAERKTGKLHWAGWVTGAAIAVAVVVWRW